MSVPELGVAPSAYEMDSLDSNHHHAASPNTKVDKKDYAVGILYLLTVILLWTLANFITQRLFVNGYEKPFLITYLTTSAFSFYLVIYCVRHTWSKYRNDSSGFREEYQPLAGAEATETHDNAEASPSYTSITRIDIDDQAAERSLPPLDVRQTAELALAFCLLWFIANWSVNASLSYTTVANATILASTSGFFTLGIGRIFRVEKLTMMKITAVFTCFLGVVLVSLSDSKAHEDYAGETPPEVGPLDASEWSRMTRVSPISTASEQIAKPLVGDALAIVSALFYAFYVILLKVRIKNEERIDMQLFFGFVGLFNILLCWPIGLVLHWTGVEPFELPTKAAEWYTIIIDMMITWLSDYLYVFAMLKTTPLVATVGLSLTIPAAVLGDTLLGVPVRLQVLIGASFVLVGFVTIGTDSKADGNETPKQARMDPMH